MGLHNSMTLESRIANLQNLGTLPDTIATLELWNLLLGCRAGLIRTLPQTLYSVVRYSWNLAWAPVLGNIA